MITKDLSNLDIYKLSKEQYESRKEAGTLDQDALYLTEAEEIDLSSYATKEYVEQNGGKIDAIKVNGTTQTIIR